MVAEVPGDGFYYDLVVVGERGERREVETAPWVTGVEGFASSKETECGSKHRALRSSLMAEGEIWGRRRY